ncbi:MAG: hypothetical protein AUG51_00290 [Acidobacteria bacterium 13_1_20CM_3_53_8]|nr:MAG: hypothetical protein AUG51_00290 [Acidobacteria bacterium 13_1_20CM_3_53_8]
MEENAHAPACLGARFRSLAHGTHRTNEQAVGASVFKFVRLMAELRAVSPPEAQKFCASKPRLLLITSNVPRLHEN